MRMARAPCLAPLVDRWLESLEVTQFRLAKQFLGARECRRAIMRTANLIPLADGAHCSPVVLNSTGNLGAGPDVLQLIVEPQEVDPAPLDGGGQQPQFFKRVHIQLIAPR